jgi:hypothetical protein
MGPRNILVDGGHSGDLENSYFFVNLLISQLIAQALPVRGAKFKKPTFEAGFFYFHFSSASREFGIKLRPIPLKAS